MMNHQKVFVVTGASRGIGAAIFSYLAERYKDAVVIGTATSEAGVASITQAARDQGTSGVGYVLDVSDPESCRQFVKTVQDNHGAISALINNAGRTSDGLVMMMKDQDWYDVLNTNLSGPFFLTKLVLKPMMKARWGRIVNITSVVAHSGNPGQANYVAAKSGLLGLTKAVALEMASRQITVNCVAPGFVATDMTNKLTSEQKKTICDQIPLGRMGSPSEIAAAVAFLLSEEAAYITGSTIHVNGGLFLD